MQRLLSLNWLGLNCFGFSLQRFELDDCRFWNVFDEKFARILMKFLVFDGICMVLKRF